MRKSGRRIESGGEDTLVLKNFDELMALAKTHNRPKTVAVPAAGDLHVLEAVVLARREGLVEPLLIGSRTIITELLAQLGERVAEGQIFDITDVHQAAQRAVDLVKEGRVDFLMKGQLNTADLLRAILNRKDGLPHGKVVTNLTILELPWYHKLLAVNDGAIIPYSTLEQKEAQIRACVQALHTLGYGNNLKVAVICANEEISPKIIETVEAAELKRINQAGEMGGCVVEGPISLDLALSIQAAKRKGYQSPVAGDADFLLFPNLISANVFNKQAEFSGATPVGVLLGASVPVAISSRSATAKSKLGSLALAALASTVSLEGG